MNSYSLLKMLEAIPDRMWELFEIIEQLSLSKPVTEVIERQNGQVDWYVMHFVDFKQIPVEDSVLEAIASREDNPECKLCLSYHPNYPVAVTIGDVVDEATRQMQLDKRFGDPNNPENPSTVIDIRGRSYIHKFVDANSEFYNFELEVYPDGVYSATFQHRLPCSADTSVHIIKKLVNFYDSTMYASTTVEEPQGNTPIPSKLVEERMTPAYAREIEGNFNLLYNWVKGLLKEGLLEQRE